MGPLINEIGNKYGKLIVLSRSKRKSSKGEILWNCKCECENVREINGTYLRNGQNKSCGCNRLKNVKDETGNKYGRLTVLERVENNKERRAMWKCQCDCGKIKVFSGKHLRNGLIVSCNCGKGFEKGHFVSSETKKKMRENHANVSGKNNPRYGISLPEETRNKIRETLVKNGSVVKEKNPNWKGGISKEHELIRGSPDYKKWRNDVFKRDKYMCYMCGFGNYIHAHHIFRFSEYPKLRFIKKNGITLCENCHEVVHMKKYKDKDWFGLKQLNNIGEDELWF